MRMEIIRSISKRKTIFYFLNPDQSQKNRYMMGLTVARQLAKQNGETLVTKNAQNFLYA